MKRSVWASLCIFIGSVAAADDIPVTANASFTFQGQAHVISQTVQINAGHLATLGSPAHTCQTPCLAPMHAANGVPTLGELDVITFLSSDVAGGDGLLVDARLPEDRAMGFIPASINIPSVTVAPTNPMRDTILQALGAEDVGGFLTFEQARQLVIFDHGPSAIEASTMITDLIAAGYPTDKLGYYRGGMQVWTALGLSVGETE